MTDRELLGQVTKYYLDSADFNGLPARLLPLCAEELGERLARLISQRVVSLNFGDCHPNPHILAFEPEIVPVQLEKLSRLGLATLCLYPSREHLATVVDPMNYAGQPFRLDMALGGPQLSHCSFDLAVLESYRNDPRYYYSCDDISGRISVTSVASSGGQIRSSDKILLKTFGFSYDEDLNRAVAVYLCYLAGLSPEHQQIWRAKMLSATFKLHPLYHRLTMGHWEDGGSLFTAFLKEQHLINEMSRLMERQPLFRESFQESYRPKAFGFLLRPTLVELNGFIHLLDKLLSDNINLDFFQGEVDRESETSRKDGKIVVRQKGSLQLLEEWLKKPSQNQDSEPRDEMIAVFKNIRKRRQRPAHAIHEDVFDQQYLKDQRQLMINAYKAMRTLRMILGTHPSTRSCKVPGWLQEEKIWTY